MKTCKKGIHTYEVKHSTCPECRRLRNRLNKKRYIAACKENIKAYGRAYREEHKERLRMSNRRFQLRHKYGITLEQYDELFTAQGGCCAICRAPQSSLNKALAVDHCHKTMVIRGLLCGHCNTGLGKFRESAGVMRSATSYLERDRSQSFVMKEGKLVTIS